MATAPADDDELTELVDFTPSRVDAVGKGANGVPRFLIAKQDEDARGLVPPELVRELIGKQAEPEPAGVGEQVTMTGSPAAMAAFIHKAALRAADRDGDVAKKKLSSKEKNDLPDSDFAYIDADGQRHFPLNDAAHVRDALSRASESPFGDKAMPKIRAAAKKFGIDVSKEAHVADDVTKAGPDSSGGEPIDGGVDGMDPTVPLAEPDDIGAGDPNNPGSPAWESIDAATAQKWTSIAVRLKNALCVMADRELIEAASADPGDADAAWDLQDAMCAVDFVIDTLAGFAVGEQAEADLAGEAMEAIGKALSGFDPAPLDALEGLAAVAKAGRVLSATNEKSIRTAAAELQKVLTSLPNAPQTTDGGQVVAKEGDTHMDDTTPAEVEKTDAPEAAELAAAPEAAAGDGQVAKADDAEPDPKMQAVFDANGKLVGVVDPSAITPVAGAVAPDAAPDATDPAAADPAAAAAGAGDMTPAPAADAGTPADDKVGKQDPNGEVTISQDVLKGIVTEAVTALLDARTPGGDVAKQADVAGLLEQVDTLKARLATVEEQPAPPKVFHNGQTPPQPVLRGQDKGGDPSQIDVGKALERKHELYTAPDAARQNEIAKEMQSEAIAQLAAIHGARR